MLCSPTVSLLHFPAVRLKRNHVIRMGYFISVVRHPQHGNILLPDVAMNNLVNVALVDVIERAGNFVQQKHLR